MLSTLRWLLPSVVPAVLLMLVIRATDRRREPIHIVLMTFAFGVVLAFGALFLETKAARWAGLENRVSLAGDTAGMIFLFALVGPLREAAKVAACWPAFLSKHFDEPYDGIVYASTAALGFAAVENAFVLRAHPTGWVWLARTLLALPAHVFFACAWGYALGRAKQSKRPGAIFPATWVVATALHGFYIHFVYGRGPGAMVAAIPLLMAMGGVVFFAARDLHQRGERVSRPSLDGGNRLSRVSFSYAPVPPSLSAVRQALRRGDQPIKLRWILVGALVTIGAMIVGLGGAIALGHWAHVDFSVVDEHDVTTTAPVALLGAGLLGAFPLSGYLVAKASSVPTLLEPALATALALVVTLVVLGLAAPVALVFALAFSPIAWGLACAGAWVGRVAR
jgi:RsiW-degrading membrane proteinase PrsW (M82 family)